MTSGMDEKPEGWSDRYGAWFEERSVANRYPLRPAYPPETFELLASLIVDSPRMVLDAGCGPGDIGRTLAPRVDGVDMVDRSEAMLAEGRRLSGDLANVRWIRAPIEEAPLAPPYALIVAGESIHWFDWERAIPLFARSLSAHGMLALVYRNWLRSDALRERLAPVYARHGANPDFTPLDPVAELERRGLFARVGEHRTAPASWTPTLQEMIDCHHSQNGFVLEKMHDPDAFDREVSDAVEELVPACDGRVQLDVTATITWGRPLA